MGAAEYGGTEALPRLFYCIRVHSIPIRRKNCKNTKSKKGGLDRAEKGEREGPVPQEGGNPAKNE